MLVFIKARSRPVLGTARSPSPNRQAQQLFAGAFIDARLKQ